MTAMHRRSFSTALFALSLGACATRSPPPPLKPNSFHRLGMLPVYERPASRDVAPFSVSTNQRRAAGSGFVPPLNPMLLGMLIGNAIRASKESDYKELADAVGEVRFLPLPVFQNALTIELAARSIESTPIGDPEVASNLRGDNFKALPSAFDGIADIELRNVGFSALGRGRGFEPYLDIRARMIDVLNPGQIAEDWSYGGTSDIADVGERDYLFPKALTQPSLSSFSSNAGMIQTEFTKLLERSAKQLAEDMANFLRDRRAPRP